jgi:hypothetical protein
MRARCPEAQKHLAAKLARRRVPPDLANPDNALITTPHHLSISADDVADLNAPE